jgi:hypothetical protein
MRTKIHLTYLVLIMIVAYMAGCSNTPTLSTPGATQTETPPTPTIFINSATFTPSLTPTPTKTIEPTLSTDDALRYVQDLMSNSGPCQLPCWMGISPGQPTLDIKTQFTLLNTIANDTYYGLTSHEWTVGGLTILSINKNMVIENRTAYASPLGENEISVIGFHTRSYQEENGSYVDDVYGYPAYREYFRSYTIPEILSKYGVPDLIYILGSLRSDKLPETPGWGDYFVIYLSYPERGIFMEYQMSVTGSGSNYRFCPSDSFISGNLMGISDSKDKNILNKLGITYQHNLSGSIYIKNPQDAFGLTDEDFYQLFHSPTSRCLETPKSIWWPK